MVAVRYEGSFEIDNLCSLPDITQSSELHRVVTSYSGCSVTNTHYARSFVNTHCLRSFMNTRDAGLPKEGRNNLVRQQPPTAVGDESV